MLAPWKKSYYKPRQSIKIRDITLLTRVHMVKAIIFPVVMYGCESWTIKKAECQRIDAFKLWCWRRLLRVPWTARRSDQAILKEINPEYSLKGLMVKLKRQYFGQPDAKSWLIGKDPDAGKDWGQEEKGLTENQMVGWRHWLHGHEFEPALGDGEGQGNLACCCPWGCKELDMTERLKNWMKLNDFLQLFTGGSDSVLLRGAARGPVGVEGVSPPTLVSRSSAGPWSAAHAETSPSQTSPRRGLLFLFSPTLTNPCHVLIVCNKLSDSWIEYWLLCYLQSCVSPVLPAGPWDKPLWISGSWRCVLLLKTGASTRGRAETWVVP